MAKNKPALIVIVSTFPPRQCGIATFSQDLLTAYNNLFLPSLEMKAIAMQSSDSKHRYSSTVLWTINQDDIKSYTEAARKINKNYQIKLVNVQHEFGIYGGSKGAYLDFFLKLLKKPVIVTLHTVLPSPDSEFIERVQNIQKLSDGLVVMTHHSKRLLVTDYAIPENKIKIIPHGIHPRNYVSTSSGAKIKLRLPPSLMLTTFGLLSKNKGIEYVIRALPAVVKSHPSAHYYIIGKTHPTVKKHEGEVYRKQLQGLTNKLELNDHVTFINRYFKTSDLLDYLEATDVYISGSLDPNQAVSGTLSYALGAGRPVISTNFSQAKEIITSDVGAIVPFKKPIAFSRAINKILNNKNDLLFNMRKNAYFKTRHMTWPNVALAYAKYFSQFSVFAAKQYQNLPPIKLDHVKALTDDFGIFQFARLHNPNPHYGYTLDDNARALLVMTQYYQGFQDSRVLRFIRTYLKFIENASTGNGMFHNYFNANRTLNNAANNRDSLEDANARCMYSLMVAMSASRLPKELRTMAKRLYHSASTSRMKSPRSIAFYVKGLYALHEQKKDVFETVKQHCDVLVKLYNDHGSSDWEWFEARLTYSNAILPEALLLGYIITGKKEYLRIGKKTLDFLISHTFIDGMYVGIGQNGWFERGGVKAQFDQQPEDPAAMVQALYTMYLINKKEKYADLMHTAFNWFLGNNMLGLFVYDTVTGGSYDGLSEKRTNLNQGAESTLVYLLARLLITI